MLLHFVFWLLLLVVLPTQLFVLSSVLSQPSLVLAGLAALAFAAASLLSLTPLGTVLVAKSCKPWKPLREPLFLSPAERGSAARIFMVVGPGPAAAEAASEAREVWEALGVPALTMSAAQARAERRIVDSSLAPGDQTPVVAVVGSAAC